MAPDSPYTWAICFSLISRVKPRQRLCAAWLFGPFRPFTEKSSRKGLPSTPGQVRSGSLPGPRHHHPRGPAARGRPGHHRHPQAGDLPARPPVHRQALRAGLLPCHAARPVPLARLVQVAGARWAVGSGFQADKNEAGLDHYQVRLYTAWYRVRHPRHARPGIPASPAPASQTRPRQARHQKSSSSPQRTRSAACLPRSAARHPTSSTPAAGHDGGTATRNAPATATTGDNAGQDH
jgi:hypothetical protein